MLVRGKSCPFGLFPSGRESKPLNGARRGSLLGSLDALLKICAWGRVHGTPHRGSSVEGFLWMVCLHLETWRLFWRLLLETPVSWPPRVAPMPWLWYRALLTWKSGGTVLVDAIHRLQTL